MQKYKWINDSFHKKLILLALSNLCWMFCRTLDIQEVKTLWFFVKHQLFFTWVFMNLRRLRAQNWNWKWLPEIFTICSLKKLFQCHRQSIFHCFKFIKYRKLIKSSCHYLYGTCKYLTCTSLYIKTVLE